MGGAAADPRRARAGTARSCARRGGAGQSPSSSSRRRPPPSGRGGCARASSAGPRWRPAAVRDATRKPSCSSTRRRSLCSRARSRRGRCALRSPRGAARASASAPRCTRGPPPRGNRRREFRRTSPMIRIVPTRSSLLRVPRLHLFYNTIRSEIHQIRRSLPSLSSFASVTSERRRPTRGPQPSATSPRSVPQSRRRGGGRTLQAPAPLRRQLSPGRSTPCGGAARSAARRAVPTVARARGRGDAGMVSSAGSSLAGIARRSL